MATQESTSTKTSTRKKAPTSKSSKRKVKITADQIRRRAAEIYQKRMRHGFQGDELSDWLQAERELKSVR